MTEFCEKLPISSFYQILKYKTISKSSKWWSLIVLFKARDRIKIGFYLFQKKDNNWKRKHKFTISSREEYEDIRNVIDKYSIFL